MLSIQRVCEQHNHEVQFIDQDDLLPAVALGHIVTVVSGLDGPPLVAVAVVLPVGPHAEFPGVFRVNLKRFVHPSGWHDLLALIYPFVEIEQAEFRQIGGGQVQVRKAQVVAVPILLPETRFDIQRSKQVSMANERKSVPQARETIRPSTCEVRLLYSESMPGSRTSGT